MEVLKKDRLVRYKTIESNPVNYSNRIDQGTNFKTLPNSPSRSTDSQKKLEKMDPFGAKLL